MKILGKDGTGPATDETPYPFRIVFLHVQCYNGGMAQSEMIATGMCDGWGTYYPAKDSFLKQIKRISYRKGMISAKPA